MGTPSSRRPNPRANSHQRSSRTSAPSPRNRGDRPPSNSPPTNTSDSQSSTSPHPRSPTATPSTVSRWDQCASTRRHTTSHNNSNNNNNQLTHPNKLTHEHSWNPR